MSTRTTVNIYSFLLAASCLEKPARSRTLGQTRLAVTFHRLIMPDGYSVSLDQFKGLDQEGATALKDKVNNHYAKIFGASLALGVLGGVAQIGTGQRSHLDRHRTDSGRIWCWHGQRRNQVLDRFLNILPTVTIREGTRVKIYLSNDLLLPEYSAHNLSRVLKNRSKPATSLSRISQLRKEIESMKRLLCAAIRRGARRRARQSPCAIRIKCGL